MSDLREAERITEMACDLRYAGYSFASEAQQMAEKVIELILKAEINDKKPTKKCNTEQINTAYAATIERQAETIRKQSMKINKLEQRDGCK